MPKSRLQECAVSLRQMIEVDQLSQKDAASRLGVHEDTVLRWCNKLRLKTQRTGPRSGDRHTGWKGGRVLISGYWHIFFPDHPFSVHGHKYVAEHRLVMEKKISRYLLPGEVVHHLNGDKRDNNPDNLVLFSRNAEHLHKELWGKIPNWSPEAKEKQQAYNNSRKYLPDDVRERRRTRVQRWRTRQKLLKFGEKKELPPTDHQPS